MGNTPSIPQGQANPPGPDQIANEESTDTSPGQRLLSSSSPLRHAPRRQRASIYGSIRLRISSRLSSHPTDTEPEPASASDDMEIDQDESPLVHEGIQPTQEDTSMTTSTQAISRSLSTVSRLGSRFMPESVRNTLWNSGEETEQEGHALRNGASAAPRSYTVPRQSASHSPSRFSLVSSIRRRIAERSESRIDPRRRTIRGPFPLGATHELLRHDPSLDLDRSLILLPSLQSTSSIRRQTRLRRVRNSLSAPFTELLHHSAPRSGNRHPDRPSPSRPARVAFAEDSDHLLPSLTAVDHRLDMDDPPHELDAVEPETRNLLANPTITSGMSTIRRFPHALRSRSTRLIRQAEYPPLSQVLQLAAAAIAAQLSGHADSRPGASRPFAGDMFDGSIQNFVQTLQEAASAQAGETIDVNASEGELPPVNFMRVFQFPNDEHGSPLASQVQARGVDAADIDQITGQDEADRSVTLVLVGVRSMPNGSDSGAGEHGHIGASLDTLLSLPFLPQSNTLAAGSPGALFRRPDLRNRIHARRHSMTNFSFPAQYESQRHQRTRNPGGRFSSDPLYNSGNIVTPLSESPPGPHPPPSTPADIRSGAVTPIRRPSSASAVHGTALPDLEEDQVETSAESTSESVYNVARQRRRSDSEFARRPELGSGAARRNGMVEPDNVSSSIGRSWLIYVVGTNVSPDHPAFTMPSLFTDNPSYEDMQMLSTLLGPVKPPVATQEDVASAGGVFRLVVNEGNFTAYASATESATSLAVKVGERCLICLCDYEAREEVRQLNKCLHLFHRECIDEWLTTGRNSCPMCRAQGVTELAAAPSSSVVRSGRSESVV